MMSAIAINEEVVQRVMRIRALMILADLITSYRAKGLKIQRLLQDIDYACGENEQLKTETYLVAGEVLQEAKAVTGGRKAGS